MIWAAGSFCIVAVLGSLAFAGIRGWRLFRTFRRVAGRISDEAARVTDAGARAEKTARGLTAGTEELGRAVARLQAAIDELAVLRRAASEPQALLATMRGALPRK